MSNSNISNIYIYVGDAVRWDATPASILNSGISIKTISSSIHTPSSFASLTTGLYPSQHRVWQFGDRIPENIDNLLDISSMNTAFTNSINMVFNDKPLEKSLLAELLRVEPDGPSHLKNVEPPFVYLERGPGGHAPYGDYDGNAWDYFEDKSNETQEQFWSEYKESIKKDEDWFRSRLELLDERDLLDETLVIYTSDHGEIVGEYGTLGHNLPIQPELVTVPTVFIHPDLNNYHLNDRLFRITDIFPTVKGIINRKSKQTQLPGVDVVSYPFKNKGVSIYSKRFFDSEIPGLSGVYRNTSIWGCSGGYVFQETSLADRIAVYLGKLLKSPSRSYMRTNMMKSGEVFLKGDRKFGNPGFSKGEARQLADEVWSLPSPTSEDSQLAVNKERLRDLGYLK